MLRRHRPPRFPGCPPVWVSSVCSRCSTVDNLIGQIDDHFLGGGVLEQGEKRSLLFEGPDALPAGCPALPGHPGTRRRLHPSLMELGFQSGRRGGIDECGHGGKIDLHAGVPFFLLTAMMPARPQQNRFTEQGKRISAGPGHRRRYDVPNGLKAIVRTDFVFYESDKTFDRR